MAAGMMPGIYYMQGGGFAFTGGGSLTANGVFIYVEPGNGNADGVNVSASGSITMTPMTTGIYSGKGSCGAPGMPSMFQRAATIHVWLPVTQCPPSGWCGLGG